MAPLAHWAIPRGVPQELSTLVSATINHLAARDAPQDISAPTRTLKPRTLVSLFQRQLITVTATSSPASTSDPKPIIPANYSGLGTGPSPGEVVGIVFGSVAGFLLILWLIYTCFSMSGAAPASSVVEEDVVIRRRSHSPRSRRRSVSSHSRSEVIEVSRTRERSRSKSRSRSPTIRSVPPARRESTRRETVIIEETRRPSRPPPQDDIVEVTEEYSDTAPKQRRSSGRQSGFRTVDPDAFGGGDRPMRKVSKRG